MATVLTDSTNYENIADAIRNQNGTSETYYPSAMAAAISELSPPTAVLYTEQTLSDEQKAQARTNIGALSTEAVKDWAKADTKPTYTKSEIGLGNVDNVKQYSANNPPPYPVTSVNGQTGEVTIDTSSIIEQNKGLKQKFWRGTQDEYDAIETKSDDTMYIVTDDSSSGGGTIGDMTKAIYDPNNIAADIFGYGYSKAEIDSLLSSSAKIQTGSYVGTGTYGASNPCSLTFDFIPKMLMVYVSTINVISGKGYSSTEFSAYSDWQMWFLGVDSLFIAGNNYNRYSLSGNTLTFYNEVSALAQMNKSDVVYKFIAIG